MDGSPGGPLRGGYILEGQRCLDSALGYIEWTGPNEYRLPWLIRNPDRDNPLVFAGLWEGSDVVESFESFTIITRLSDGSPFHWLRHTMPVMVQKEDYDAWLFGSPEDADEPFRRSDAIEPETYRVSQEVNSPQNDGPELLEPVDDMTLGL